MNIGEIASAIAGIDADPALCAALKAQLASAAPNFVKQFSAHNRRRTEAPFPDPSKVTAAQMSVFDNWIEYGGKRPKRGEPGHDRDRWKVTMDLWTTPAATLDLKTDKPAFSGTSHLWTGADIVKRHEGRKESFRLPKVLNPAFRQEIAAMARSIDKSARMGFVYTPMGKTIAYHDALYLIADNSALEAHDIFKIVVAFADGRSFAFQSFQNRTSKGNPLEGNCFAHSRMTTVAKVADSWSAHLMGADQ